MRKNSTNQADPAWKDILDIYLKDFIDFCLRELSNLIDWSKGWVPLDKELHSITKDNITGARLADKLVQVYLKNGSEQWILIHIEVHGKPDADFPLRMFIYGYRLFDKYQQPVVSCAILTDGRKSWRPNYFEVGMAGSKLRLDYIVIKLTDYESQIAELETDNRPFASVILTHLIALSAIGKSDIERCDIKYCLTRRLYYKGMNKDQIKYLYYFIDWLIGLPAPLELEYLQKVYELEESKKMPYISTAERIGIEKGLERGVLRGESTFLICLIKHKFGSIGKRYQERINHADGNTLLAWGEKVLDAKTLKEVFEDK